MLAAVLLMQAVAGAVIDEARGFDLAALSGDSAGPTVAEALAATASDDRCGPRDADPFGTGVIVVCGERPRASYQIEGAGVAAPVPQAVDRLNPHIGCGTSLNPNGCFAAVPVVRMTSDGRVSVLPDRPREALVPRRPTAGE